MLYYTEATTLSQTDGWVDGWPSTNNDAAYFDRGDTGMDVQPNTKRGSATLTG